MESWMRLLTPPGRELSVLASAREKLALQQSALVDALASGVAALEGFNAGHLQVAADALARKRRRAVAKSWPALARSLGKSFMPRFAEFAADNPLTHGADAFADGRHFARWLARRNELPDGARVEAALFDLRTSKSCTGFKTIWLRSERRFVFGMRLPCLGVRFFSIRLPVLDRVWTLWNAGQ